MNLKDKFLNVLLSLIVTILLAVIGIFGYIIYSEIIGDKTIQLSFGGEAGYPTIEFNQPEENTNANSSNNGEFGTVIGKEDTNQQTGKYLYKQLDKNAQIIYDKLYSNKENLKTGTYTVDFGDTFTSLLSKENGDVELQKQYQSAIEALLYENPDIFYLNATNMYINIEKITRITGVKYNVYINSGNKPNYLEEGFESKQAIDECQIEIEQVRDEILGKVANKSDYEKIKIVHDYLIDNIIYDTTISQDNIYNIYGALVSGKCVCEGYAKSFQYLMNEIGIENVIVIGTGTNSNNKTENHAWNYVKLEGKWYAIDVTWDDPIIIGGGKLSNQSRYQYFLKGEKTMAKNHTAIGNFTEEGQVFTYPELSIEDYK